MESIFRKRLFGGEIEFIIYGESYEKVQKIIDEIYIEALKFQKIFNFFDETSELSQLNKKRKMKVSKDLLHVLRKAIQFSKITNGKYDITFLK